MKFIMLVMTFEALTNGTVYKNQDVLQDKFKRKYVKVSEIDEIMGPISFKILDAYSKKFFVRYNCEIAMKDGHVAVVDQECDYLMNDINQVSK